MLKLIFVNETNLSSMSVNARSLSINIETSVWLLERTGIKQMLTPANIKLVQAVESLWERLAE
jgi:hypothetical protein